MHNQIFAYPAGECNANQRNPLFPPKAQIVSTPNASPTQRNRYRVVFEEKILGDKLTLDEALRLAKTK